MKALLAPSLALAVATGGCAVMQPSTVAYRFRAPLLSGVAAAELPWPDEAAAPAHRPPRDHVEPLDRPLLASLEPGPAADPPAIEPRLAPHVRAPATGAEADPGSPIREALLAQVGARPREESHVFALRALAALGIPAPPWTDGIGDVAGLIAAARAAGSLLAPPCAEVLPGHLVAFEGAAIVGVVSGRHDSGALEFVYAWRGVVRRGFVTPEAPARQRDTSGRILNTFVRPYVKGDALDQPYLAGELLSGCVPLGAGARRP